ncbi:MAG: M36 family metallopeptidase [Bacteroidota bacterium]
MFRLLLLAALMFAVPQLQLFAQPSWQTANEVFKQKAHEFQLSQSDVSELELLSTHRSKRSGLTHFYAQQHYNGIAVENAIVNLHFTDAGQLHHLSSRAVVGLKDRIVAQKSNMTAEQALKAIFSILEYDAATAITTVDATTKRAGVQVFEAPAISNKTIPMHQVYQLDDAGQLVLAWVADIDEKDSQDWWQINVDATTGKLLSKHNHTLYCQWDHAGFDRAHDHDHDHAHENVEEVAIPSAESAPFLSGSYRVFPIGVESPIHGERTLLSNPHNNIASPFGWHDTNGRTGAEFTITRGNNVYAVEDIDGDDGNGYSPNGGNQLVFDYNMDISQPSGQYIDASVTNLFYWNNIMHDIFYLYGFDEAAGNFQVDNYNRGIGSAEDDSVRADAQDGAGVNNATFGTAADGSNAVMTMFLFSGSSTVEVTQPSNVANIYQHTIANWENSPNQTVTGDVLNVVDSQGSTEACANISMGLTNAIALIDRGNCEFGSKALRAQQAGAIGVVICNNEAGAPITMGGGTDSPQVTIPVAMIRQDDCANIRNQPNLRMTISPAGVAKDGSLDNGIIAHEYGHGISIRMTGGRNTGACLNNSEQMGEGWSDWFGLMVTMKPTDTRFDDRGVGTFAVSQGTNGNGIRTYRYSTDMDVNPHTYNNVSDFAGAPGPFGGGNVSVHGVGSVWAEMLWEMTWNLIDKHGFDQDLYTGNGGNNIAMALVTEGLNLQPCNPGFVDGRDAILSADQALYGGANQCEIWCAFAKRGLGANANQGDSNSVTDGTENFDIPNNLNGCDCNSLAALPIELTTFEGTALAEENLLQWETASEINIGL